MWPNRRYLDLVGIDHPIIQAPMAGANLGAMAIAVSRAGGLGSLPCGMLDVEQARAELNVIRQQTDKPINVNFFCHEQPAPDAGARGAGADGWRPTTRSSASTRPRRASGGRPTGCHSTRRMCRLMVEMRPRVVSFHYGLPERSLVEPLKAAGCVIQGTATTVEEARWLEAHGADAIVAQGLEAGGHRGMFLARDIASQVGTFASGAADRRMPCACRSSLPAALLMRAASSPHWRWVQAQSRSEPAISCAPRPRSRHPIERLCNPRATIARCSPTS